MEFVKPGGVLPSFRAASCLKQRPGWLPANHQFIATRLWNGKGQQFSLKISHLDTCHQSLLGVNLVTSNCQDQGENPSHSSRMRGVPLSPHPNLGKKQNSGVEIFIGPHAHLEGRQNSEVEMFWEAQTRVATVMKWRREMLASKLFWMYLKSANILIVDINNALHLKIWFRSGFAPPVELNATCSNPKEHQPGNLNNLS